MIISQIEIGKIYECKIGKRIDAVVVRDILQGSRGGIIGQTLTTKREIFIKAGEVYKRVNCKIENMNEWRLKNGD